MSAIKYWTSYSGYTPLLEAPNGTKKINGINIPPNSVVTATTKTIEFQGVKLYEVVYQNYTGWVDAARVELYQEHFDTNCVDISDIETADPTDAAQYVNWNGYKQVNMCGELCVAYIAEMKLSAVLSQWQEKKLPFYKRVFGGGRAAGTGASDLVELFGLFGIIGKQMTQKQYTPAMLEELSGRAIVSVRIDGATGRLRGSGILHWVVVVGSLLERTGYGIVYLYNPYPNKIEVYSYAEFIASARSPYGVIVG